MAINAAYSDLNGVFSGKAYCVDFYQRDYKWNKEQVNDLLDDLMYLFEQGYDPDIDATRENIAEYDWYYLSTFVFDASGARLYVVDGQQRLTTLTLLLIKLMHLDMGFGEVYSAFIRERIASYIPEGKVYRVAEEYLVNIFDKIFETDEAPQVAENGLLSYKNISSNYKVISDYLDEKLKTEHKFSAFLLYLLYRVFIVEISITKNTDVPMVFEVINDRGEKLKPYEVLKGKLLGQINKKDLTPYEEIWDELIHKIQLYSDNEVDRFFRFYFGARYSTGVNDRKELDGDYHKTLFLEKWANRVHLKKNPTGVKEFLNKELKYYGNIYLRLLKASKEEDNADFGPYIYFNGLNELDTQYLLCLSVCSKTAGEENERINLVGNLFDRNYVILQLVGCYTSQSFNDAAVELAVNIRSKTLEEIRADFDKQLIETIKEKRVKDIKSPFLWSFFKDASIENRRPRFIRYFFARLEHKIASEINEQSGAPIDDLVRKRGPKHGFHIEHIISDNKENRGLFENDDALFESIRNKFGAITLLKGVENLSLSNDTYKKKLGVYATGSLWLNKIIAKETVSHRPRLKEFIKSYKLNTDKFVKFDKDAVAERQRFLYDISKTIWVDGI